MSQQPLLSDALSTPPGALPTGGLPPAWPPRPYEAVVRWEYRLPGQVRRSIISRHLTLSREPLGPDQLVTLRSTPPTLRQPDPTALEELTLLLAGLYQQLVLQTTRAGQPRQLLNHDELLRIWALIEQEATTRFGREPDGLTDTLLTAVAQQVTDPAALLTSLRYDYVYDFLLKSFHLRPDAGPAAQMFPHFFADTDLSFRVTQTPLPDSTPGCVGYCLHGTLDEARTNVEEATRQVAAELAPEADPAPVPPAPDRLTFTYQATYVVEVLTGQPVRIAATVSCQGPAGYAKEYDLTIEQL